MFGLTSCQAVNQQTSQIRFRNAPNFNQLYLRHFWTDLLPVFSIIICSSQATKLSATGSAPHFRFHLEIPNFKSKICPKSKYNLHFLHNRLEFRNQVFTQNFYIFLAAACKARTKSTIWKLNRKPQTLPLFHAAPMRNITNSWLPAPVPPQCLSACQVWSLYSKPFLRYLGKTSPLSTPVSYTHLTLPTIYSV